MLIILSGKMNRKNRKRQKKKKIDFLAFLKDEDDDLKDAYEDYMCGGEITDNYMM